MRLKLSIRALIVGLGIAGVVIASSLAGFGLLGMHEQLVARKRVVVLEQAAKNHSSADTFMDSVRTDVLRALQVVLGSDREDVDSLRADFEHHIDMVNAGIGDNQLLSLGSILNDDYRRIGALLPEFVSTSRSAVDLALKDAAAGAANFEVFRHSFTRLEELMDDVRERERKSVEEVRQGAAQTARRGQRMIIASVVGGIMMLTLITVGALRLAQRITYDLASSREEAQHLALHDTLTGLPNRAFLAERLQEALGRARRESTSLAVLCLDLDRFKQVNDTLGHAVGDAVLQAVAERLRASVRRSDTVVRLGGDEFAIIHSSIETAHQTGELANRIVDVLSEPYDIGAHQIVIGASVGIALAPADSMRADILLKMADMALYRAKAAGRGTSRFFETGMDNELQARRRLELDLRRAVAVGEFELHYQPLIDVSTRRICAMESLIRWRHPERGLVPPDEFIPLAEETGLIVAIGKWVLRQACRDAATWPQPIRVAVNISAVEIKHLGLLEVVSQTLSDTGLAPERLEIEVTETILLTDTAATLATLNALTAMGIHIALDDFGTGYSSLNYLRRFPFNKIKIDRSFVQDIVTDPDCNAIVGAVTSLGTHLGMATTAEGVETVAQFEQLKAQGCSQVQGYLFSRPVPASDVLALFKHQQMMPAQREPAFAETSAAAA